MSLHLPARRAANATRASITKPSTQLQYRLPQTQRRHGWLDAFKWGGKKAPKDESPLTKELARREREQRGQELAARSSDRTQGATIFDEDIKAVNAADPQAKDKAIQQRGLDAAVTGYSKMKEHMEMALNPDPRWKVRYQRKKIMQMVRADGKLTREEKIKLTEKEVTVASTPLPTSTKKLVHLAHQIVGKTVEEAIVQMRFSKKRMAREVKYELEEARDTAIVKRGMGLGLQDGETPTKRVITTKDGKKLQVHDPTRLYVDESWVTKGPKRGMRIQYHARGRMSRMWRPTTRIHVVLKEEKTRIRQHEERVAKEAKKAPWLHLPNRPVTAQRQYYSW